MLRVLPRSDIEDQSLLKERVVEIQPALPNHVFSDTIGWRRTLLQMIMLGSVTFVCV
jgi:hypothetical protein